MSAMFEGYECSALNATVLPSAQKKNATYKAVQTDIHAQSKDKTYNPCHWARDTLHELPEPNVSCTSKSSQAIESRLDCVADSGRS